MATSTPPGLNGEPTERITHNGVTAEVPRTSSVENGSGVGSLSGEETANRLAEADQKLSAALPNGVDLHAGIAGWQSTSHHHPVIQITKRFPGDRRTHQARLSVFHALRQYISTVDLAIENRRDIEGNVIIRSEDEGLQRDLRNFAQNVPVGFIDGAPLRGLNTYLNHMCNAADEYGLAAGEIILTGNGQNIDRLVLPEVESLHLQDQNRDGLYELYQSQSPYPSEGSAGRQMERIDDNDRVQILAFKGTMGDGPWPKPLAWSLVQSGEVILRMYEAIANAWWRFGDPSILVTEEYEQDASPDTKEVQGVDIPVSLLTLQKTMQQVFKDRRSGKVSDAYHASKGAEVNHEVIGQVDQSMTRWFDQHHDVFAGKVIGHSQVPVWMFPEVTLGGEGMNSDRSQKQAVMASVAARKRNKKKGPLAKKVLDEYLIARGMGQFTDRYTLDYDEVSLIDDKVEADAALTRAEADEKAAQAANLLFADGERRFDGDAESFLEERGVYDDG